MPQTQQYSYALGIDLGISSIGTALLRLHNDGTIAGILDAGVRIFDIPNGAAERRAKRQSRKAIAHRRARLRKLTSYLQDNGLLPTHKEELRALLRRSPYRLRAHGVSFRFNHIYELGRCLLHIAKFRGAGFLTQQEESSELADGQTPKKQKDSQKSANLYRVLETRIREEKISLGQFFMQRIRNKKEKGRVRRRTSFIKENLIDYAVPRFLVKEDFHRLWARQSQYYPLLTDSLKDAVYSIIFADRPHAPYANSPCSLNPDSGEMRLPRMHRLAEERRIFEQINNLRYATNRAEYSLSKTMRDTLVAKAMAGETLTKATIKATIAPLSDEKITSINLDGCAKIAPHSHAVAFKNISAWSSFSQQEQDALIDFIAEPRLEPSNPHSRLMPEDEYIQECITRLQLTGALAEKSVSQCIALLPSGRSSLGITATLRIIEKLKAGIDVQQADGTMVWRAISQREAADACGYDAEEELRRAHAGKHDTLPYYGELLRHDVSPIHPWHRKNAAPLEAQYGRIPNPVVHVALNQLRKVVNEIVTLYGKPQRIHIELAREFGMSAQKREELAREQKSNAKKNNEIDEALRALNLSTKRDNRVKYRLWQEQNGIDLYTGKNIQATEFKGYEIDHIIPRSRGGTNTYANLTLTASEVNRAKGDDFAYNFIQRVYPERWGQIFATISDAKKFPKSKAWRFGAQAEARFINEGDAEQTDRRLTDTRYMAKMAARYLSALCADVVPICGAMTACLRHHWGLDGLEYELTGQAIPSKVIIDPQTGYEKRNPLWKAKPRIDHRHHAMDAIVVACASRSLAQYMARCERLGQRLQNIAPPFMSEGSDFRHAVLETLRQVKVSIKPEHGLAGQLHNATKYRVLCPAPKSAGKFVRMYQRPFEKCNTKRDVAKIVFTTSTLPSDNEIIQNALEKCRYQRDCIESMYEEAELWLAARNKELIVNNNKPSPVTEKHIVQQAIKLAQKRYKDVGHTYKSVGVETLVGVCLTKQCGFKPDGNIRVDFFIDAKQEVGWECIKRFDANQKNFIPQWQQAGYKRLWSLFKGDIVELTISEELRTTIELPVPAGKVLFTVQKFSAGTLQLNLITDARALDCIEGQQRWVSKEKPLSFFTKAAARKIELTPFGKIQRKHARLWHGSKTNKK